MNEWEWRLLEDRAPAESIQVAGTAVRVGSRVRLRPRGRGDAMDLMVDGKTATVESIEQDYEGTHHLAVVIDDDPGRDLGLQRQPGHRFFFSADDVEPLGDAPAATDTVPAGTLLIAGIGNIFMGDDGFGVEVAQRLSARTWPPGVRVVDFGIRSFDLAYALMDAPDATILIDACPRGEAPGTLSVIEPDLASLDDGQGQGWEPHGMNPVSVLRMARSMGGTLTRILVVGCEPATLGPEEGQLGLSDGVSAVIDDAVDLVETLVKDIREGHWPGDRARVPDRARQSTDAEGV